MTFEHAVEFTVDEASRYALRVEGTLPLGTTPFSWITTASINMIGADDEEAFGDNSDLGAYWLIPIMTGAGYPIAMGPSIGCNGI